LTIGLDQEAKYLRTIDVQGADYTEKVGTEVDNQGAAPATRTLWHRANIATKSADGGMATG